MHHCANTSSCTENIVDDSVRSKDSIEIVEHSLFICTLSCSNAGQNKRKCSREPTSVPGHEGVVHIPLVFPLQCLASWSVTYLPESIFALLPYLLHKG